jgi:outer membrane receptor for ferrienterochelin and colicin
VRRLGGVLKPRKTRPREAEGKRGHAQNPQQILRTLSILNLRMKTAFFTTCTIFSTAIFSIFFSFFVCQNQANAQRKTQTISGYITDEATGESLIGANVYDANSKLGTATNVYGFYSLTLPMDTVLLAVSYIGLQPNFAKFLLQKDTSLSFNLSESTAPLIEVIAADMVEAIEERNQMSQITIPIEQIKRLPAFLGEVDVLKILQLLPGVQSGEGSSGLYVRGGSPDQTLILLDGVPVYNAYHLFGFFSVFNADAVKSVTLTKGGYPARYGGRLASILEINMREGNMKRLEGEGSVGLISSKFTISAPIIKNKAAFMLSARRTYIDILARPLILLAQRGQDGQAVPGYYFYDLNGKANYIINDKNRVFLSFYAGDDKFSLRYNESFNNGSSTEKFALNSRIQWGNLTTALRWNHQFSGKLFSNSTLTYSQYKFVVASSFKNSSQPNGGAEESNEFAATYSSGINDMCAKIDFDYMPTPVHRVRFGGGATHHTFRPGATNLRLAADSSTLNINYGDQRIPAFEYATYVEDDINIGKSFGANIGLHASAFAVDSAFYYSVQPRAALRFVLPWRVALKASFATMTQYIHLLTNEGIGLPTDLWVPSTATVKPEQSWQGALGFAKTFKGGYEVSIEGYYRGMRNLISYLPGASFLDMDSNSSWQNKIASNGTGSSYGAELFVQKQKGRFTGWISYTLAWNWRQFADTDINFGKPYPFKYDRRHNLALAGVYQFNERISLSAAWVYGTGNAVTLPTERYLSPNTYNGSPEEVQGISSKNAFRMPAYHRLDCSIDIKKELKNWSYTWSFGVYNLYNRQNPFFIFAARNLETGNQEFRQVSLFPIIPSVRWDFRF